jgi:hypothetical protein
VTEIAAGLWHWQARHPQWESAEPWDPHVSSYAIDDGERLLLFDPLALPDAIEALAAERESAIVLTCPWHERDTRRLIERLGVPVHAPRPDTAQDLMDKFGITAEQAGDGSPDLTWLGAASADWRPYAAGDRLPVGIEAFPGREHNDLVLWIEARNAIVAGDTLVDFGDGLEINPRWLRAGVTRKRIVAGLTPLLDRPVEHVLPTHGSPVGRAELERALG